MASSASLASRPSLPLLLHISSVEHLLFIMVSPVPHQALPPPSCASRKSPSGTRQAGRGLFPLTFRSPPLLWQGRGPKKHLKRLNAPKHWMLDKLSGVFVRWPPQPSLALCSFFFIFRLGGPEVFV